MRLESARAHGLAGLGAAQPEHMPAWRDAAEMVIETDHPVHFGATEVEGMGDDRHRGRWHMAELGTRSATIPSLVLVRADGSVASTDGIGMTIGSVFGRLAGEEAGRHARG